MRALDWDEEEPTGLHHRRRPIAVSTARQPDRLTQLEGRGAPQVFDLAGTRVVLGRSEETDIRLPSPQVSRQHLAIERRDGEVVATDLDSRHGFFLNRVRVHSAVLCDQDVLQVGDCVFIYRRGTGWRST